MLAIGGPTAQWPVYLPRVSWCCRLLWWPPGGMWRPYQLPSETSFLTLLSLLLWAPLKKLQGTPLLTRLITQLDQRPPGRSWRPCHFSPPVSHTVWSRTDPRPCSPSGRPTQAGPQLPLYGSNMHPRNPRWFSRGLQSSLPSGISADQLSGAEDKTTTKHPRVSIALWRGNAGLPLSHLHWMDTLRYLLLLFFLIFYSFVLYPLVCPLQVFVLYLLWIKIGIHWGKKKKKIVLWTSNSRSCISF